ncbi:uncharacterized protein [Typha angustifolia]|uniref:uncharacterized protein n=1 Tax=Typha angustifolia TaxID=59011 RepID=UPI003C30C368
MQFPTAYSLHGNARSIMKYKEEDSKDDDSSIRLEIVNNANSGSSNLESWGSTLFEPQRESSDRTPTPRQNEGMKKLQAPEKKLTLFALRLAVLEKSASGIGKLAFVWATVVLLGGFAVTLTRKDFWYVTVILVGEGTRIFSRSHELEWQHQATWTIATAGRYSFRLLKSGSRFFVRAVKALFNPLSAVQTEGDRSRELSCDNRSGREFLDQVVRYRRRTTWHPPEVPLLPYAGWVFLSKNISSGLTWLQIASATACVTLSLIRLVEQNYGEVTMESTNRGEALNLFYGLALAEALMFLMEKAYWTWKISYCNLLKQVSRECELGESGTLSIRRFFYDAYSKCIVGSVFDGLKMDLVTFAEELLDSNFPDEQLMGARILQKFAKSETFAFDTLRKIGTSTWVIERLIEMLNWKNLEEKEIRRCAAEIVSKLAGKRQNALRVAGIPGSLEAISSLLYTGQRTNNDINEISTFPDQPSYDYSTFNLLGLLILKKLANDHDNCWKIGNAHGLLAKIIDFTRTRESLLRNEHTPDSQIRQIKRSLQLLMKLTSTTGITGKNLRQEISEVVFTVSNMREILQYGERHIVLQKLGIEILTSLAMDEIPRERIGSTGGIIKLLLSIFISEKSVSLEAGEALAMLALESKKNCILISKQRDVLERLVDMLQDPIRRLNASRILRNLCAYSGPESSDRLSRVTAALPTVLYATMNEKEKLLEVSVGLTTQICKFMGSVQFAEELEKAGIKEPDYVDKLIQILQEYTYPEIKVPRIRRFVTLQVIWMMKSNEKYLELFKNSEMEKLLESVADTTSDLECFHAFSGSVGLSRHRKTVSSILDSAINLLAGRSSQEE